MDPTGVQVQNLLKTEEEEEEEELPPPGGFGSKPGRTVLEGGSQ